MEKRIIKNGDIICIDSLALQPAEIVVDELGHKTFKVDTELEVKNEEGAILGATLIFKYIGAGKFEEMMTNKIYLSDGFAECIEYGVEDHESISFVDKTIMEKINMVLYTQTLTAFIVIYHPKR